MPGADVTISIQYTLLRKDSVSQDQIFYQFHFPLHLIHCSVIV